MNKSEYGGINPLLIVTIVLGILTIGLGGLSVWAYMGYVDHRDNVQAKVDVAVREARDDQKKSDEADFVQREKQPTREFNGPDDLGRVRFSYPKTWSAHIAELEDSSFEAYLHPGVLPPIDRDSAYALRVLVEDRSYDTVVDSYESLVRKGDIRAYPVEINGFTAIRLDGTFQNDVKGSAVLFKIRDKALILHSDSDEFVGDFNDIVLKSLEYNP